MLEGAQKICPEPIFMKLDTQMAKITVNKEKPIFAKKPWQMHLKFVKMKNSKIGLRHVLSWAKRGHDPNFHESE